MGIVAQAVATQSSQPTPCRRSLTSPLYFHFTMSNNVEGQVVGAAPSAQEEEGVEPSGQRGEQAPPPPEKLVLGLATKKQFLGGTVIAVLCLLGIVLAILNGMGKLTADGSKTGQGDKR